MFDAYVCFREGCGHISKQYFRFCTVCSGEKTHKLKTNELLKRLLINIVSLMPLEELERIERLTYGEAYGNSEVVEGIQNL